MIKKTHDLDYKIETKPTYWIVQRERGDYEYSTNEKDYIAANSKKEAWELYQRYWVTAKHGTTSRLRYGKDHFIDQGWRVRDDWYVSIHPLNVILFKK